IEGLEPVEVIIEALSRPLALMGVLGPSDVVVGQKGYEFLIALNQVIHDFHIPTRLRSVPSVRMPAGLLVSSGHLDVVAEAGADKVLEVVNMVLDAAGIEADYVALRGLDLGPAPEQGDARLLVAANIGGVRLTDNVGLPLGIGFRNIEEHAEGTTHPDS